jgi:hypothetical protein
MGGPAAARAFASSVTRRHPELVYDFWDRALDPRSSILDPRGMAWQNLLNSVMRDQDPQHRPKNQKVVAHEIQETGASRINVERGPDREQGDDRIDAAA